MKTETLLKMLSKELSNNGIGFYSEKRKAIEEILRGRNVNIGDYLVHADRLSKTDDCIIER